MKSCQWRELYEKGNAVLKEDLSKALDLFSASSCKAGGSQADLADLLAEDLLDVLCTGRLTKVQSDEFSSLVVGIYELSEGEIYLLSEMFQRSPAFVEKESCHILFRNILALVPGCLSPVADPEMFGNLFDGICALAADCRHSGGIDGSDELLISRLTLLRNCFTENWMDLNEEEFFEIVGALEDTDPEDIQSSLEDLLDMAENGSEEDYRMALDGFLYAFFLF